MMSLRAKRELLGQIVLRYREADRQQRTVILDEFIAATGYDRKYAIRLLSKPVVPRPGPIKRPRKRSYGPAVQDALIVAWSAANFICAKRLVPFLPDLIASLESHGHLALENDVRSGLLAMSAATADRILRDHRQGGRPYGVSTTKAGKLLKHQVPMRTFSDWDEVKPGFFEADLVAHCGPTARGAFLYTLVLTDVCTGWTECIALRYKGQQAVIEGVTRTRALLPFPVLGMDTDNGTEFLNHELLTYCGREGITFTRGRAYRKNDQCFVEQKNGAIVRQIVGYDRFEGEAAYQQLAELYRALRLYVNFFQPSVKLREKHRQGAKVQRQYDAARTPFQRLLNASCLTGDTELRLRAVYNSIDPVRLLQQIHTLQDALWHHAIDWPTGATVNSPRHAPARPRSFDAAACIAGRTGAGDPDTINPTPAHLMTPAEGRKRKYNKSPRKPRERNYRTRIDPFATVADELQARLLERPERNAKELLAALQTRYPGQYPSHLLRTLQRRVQKWRTTIIIAFDDHLVKEDLIASQSGTFVLKGVQFAPDPALATVAR